MRYLWLTGTKVKYEYHMSCRTKTIEAMRSCQWRLFSYSHCSAAFCLSPGAQKKISCTRWFLNLPFYLCLVLSLANDRILILICKFSSRTPWPQVLLPLLYAIFIWILPCCSFVMGVKKVRTQFGIFFKIFQRRPFLLLPWILVSCVLGMVAEMFLLWAAGCCR